MKVAAKPAPRWTRRCGSVRVLASAVAEAGPVTLPPDLRKCVAVLEAPNASAPGGKTQVYVLGVSHVSQRSVEQVQQLVRSVRPEVVMVELCKDRLGLLVGEDKDSMVSQTWHCRKVVVEGLPTGPEWPTMEQLRPLLRTRAGRPVTVQDIEADVFALLATGLFRQVMPSTANPTVEEAPEFVASVNTDGDVRVQLVPPLGLIRFTVKERSLPPLQSLTVRVDSSLKVQPVPQAQVTAACQAALVDHRSGTPTLLALLRARKALGELFEGSSRGAGVTVAFSGLELGQVEAVVKAHKPQIDGAFVSGFESSAVNSEGLGIDRFRPTRNVVKISDKLFLAAETVEALRAKARTTAADSAPLTGSAAAAVAAAQSLQAAQPRSQFRLWSQEEADKPAKAEEPDGTATGTFMRLLLTLAYARHQSNVGKKVGVEPGAAWRAALEAATEVGAQQFLLSDRPTTITDARLGEAMLGASGGRLFAAVLAVLGSIAAGVALDYPTEVEVGAVVGASALAAALMWPLIRPLGEIEKLAGMSAEEIERVVSLKQPVQGPGASDPAKPSRLEGEDALLDWPGASGPLLDERDEYMARATAAAAAGSPSSSFVPGFVLDRQDGQLVWRYMMPEGAPPQTAPQGVGDGAYVPLPGARAVVQVVGTAHVTGIMRRWQQALQEAADVAATQQAVKRLVE